MAITAAQVNELRQKTGAGMMDCKKALTEADGDFEKAIEILRKKGASVASKRAEKSANEGMVVTKVSDDAKKASIIEVNCETDFVAKSDDFVKLAAAVVESAFSASSNNAKELLEADKNLNDKLVEVMGKVGEKVEVSRVYSQADNNGLFVDYIHMGSKLGVLVKFDNVTAKNDELVELGKNIAMQVVAMNPISISRDGIDKNIVEKEKEIYLTLAKNENKPDKIAETIVNNKVERFFQDNCLLEQEYINESGKSIQDIIAEFNKKDSNNLEIAEIVRYQLGEEIK